MKKPKQPDRWERIVEKEWWGENGGVVAAILRREHRAVMRLVRGERWCSENSYYAKVYNQAIDAVLAKLKQRGQ